MTKKITTFLALVLAAGLIAAGCGDDDDDTTTSAATTTTSGATGATGSAGGEPLSESEFTAQGNQICKQVNQKLNAPQGGGESEEEFVTKTFIPTIEDGLAELGQLTPPEADADAYQALLDEGQKVLDGIKQDPSSLGPDAFDEFNRMAADLGLTVCGS